MLKKKRGLKEACPITAMPEGNRIVRNKKNVYRPKHNEEILDQ